MTAPIFIQSYDSDTPPTTLSKLHQPIVIFKTADQPFLARDFLFNLSLFTNFYELSKFLLAFITILWQIATIQVVFVSAKLLLVKFCYTIWGKWIDHLKVNLCVIVALMTS